MSGRPWQIALRGLGVDGPFFGISSSGDQVSNANAGSYVDCVRTTSVVLLIVGVVGLMFPGMSCSSKLDMSFLTCWLARVLD